MEISICFEGMPGDKNDKNIMKICIKHGGEFQGGGTYIGEKVPCRDVQYKLPKKNVIACKKELIEAGYKDIK